MQQILFKNSRHSHGHVRIMCKELNHQPGLMAAELLWRQCSNSTLPINVRHNTPIAGQEGAHLFLNGSKRFGQTSQKTWIGNASDQHHTAADVSSPFNFQGGVFIVFILIV